MEFPAIVFKHAADNHRSRAVSRAALGQDEEIAAELQPCVVLGEIDPGVHIRGDFTTGKSRLDKGDGHLCSLEALIIDHVVSRPGNSQGCP